MAAERGQATVEWIGLLLLIALALTALSRLAPAADERSLGTTLARSLTAAAKRPGGREPTRSSTPTRSALPQRAAAIPPAAPRPPGAALRGAAAIPPPAPPPLGAALRGATAIPPAAPRPQESAALPRPAGLPARRRPPLRLPDVPKSLRRAGRGAGALWRRAWFACLVYERTRYAFMHPESRFPGYTIPFDVALRMANNCVSPVDLVRDWQLLDPEQ